jgi:hypothetical protein
MDNSGITQSDQMDTVNYPEATPSSEHEPLPSVVALKERLARMKNTMSSLQLSNN